MSSPTISVITVCYNAALKLTDTIESVLNQAYANIEYIVIDGGSTDDTTSILKRYDGRLKWISEPDEGIYDAMNKGTNMATGDWVYFLGAGDIVQNVLRDVAVNMTKANCIYYGNVYIDHLDWTYDGKFPGHKLAVININHQAIFYPAAVFKRYRYNLKYRFFADHHLNMLCYGDRDFTFKYLPLTICNYEGNGLSHQNPDLVFFRDKPALIKQNFPLWIYVYTRLRSFLAGILKSKPAYGLG